MEIADLTAVLQPLIARIRAWDDALGDDDGSLSPAARSAFVDELRGIVGASPQALPSTRWQAIVEFFSPRAPSDPGERARDEQRRLLRTYEQLCELDLPFHVSSVLLRQYSDLKLAGHVADERLRLPTPSRGVAAAIDHRAPDGGR